MLEEEGLRERLKRIFGRAFHIFSIVGLTPRVQLQGISNKCARAARTSHSLLWQLQRSLCGGPRCLLSFGQYPLHHPEAIDADGRRPDTRGLILRPKLMTESAAYRVHWRSTPRKRLTRRQRSTRRKLSSHLRDAAVAHIDMRTGDHARDLVLEPTAAVAPDDPNYSRRLWHRSPRSRLR